jgi:polyhydroxyalkanoate synthesis regulator phasin
MSTTPPPPDRPTERLRPTPPEVPPPVAYERVVDPGVPVATDTGLLYARLEDSIASLRTGLVVLGLLAVIALGVALYSLLKDDANSSRGTRDGASNARVTRVNDRVDRLSRQVQSLRTGGTSPAALAGRVDALSRSVTALRNSAASGANAAPDPTKAIQDLSTRIDDLDRQVQALKQSQTTTP